MPILLLLLFLLVPLAELYAIITIGQQIGAWLTIALLVASSVAGAALLRQQGRSAWRRLTAALAEGRIPARETIDGALIILGGALLLTPGFVTDVVGLMLLIPPSRTVVRLAMLRVGLRRLTVSMAGPRTPPASPSDGSDIDGTATEVDSEARILNPRSGAA